MIKVLFFIALAFVGAGILSAFASVAFMAAGSFILWSFTKNPIPMVLMLAAAGLYHLYTLDRR